MSYQLIKLTFFLLVISFSSCTTAYYCATQQNILRFKEKGDANLAVAIDKNGSNCYNVGYAITNYIAVISDFKTFKYNSGFTGRSKTIGTFQWDNELIVYKKFKNYIPAVNFGFGFGQIDRNSTYYNLGVSRQFIQPSIGYSNDYFDVAFSTRFSRVNYNLQKLRDFDLNTTQTFEQYFFLNDVGKQDFYFFEPALTIGLGYKTVKLRFQKIAINQLSTGKIHFDDTNSYLTLNFTFNIDDIFKKEK